MVIALVVVGVLALFLAFKAAKIIFKLLLVLLGLAALGVLAWWLLL